MVRLAPAPAVAAGALVADIALRGEGMGNTGTILIGTANPGAGGALPCAAS